MEGFDYSEMAHEIAMEADGLDVLICDKPLPQGDPSTLPPPPEPPPTPDSAPVALALLHLGDDRRPQGAPHLTRHPAGGSGHGRGSPCDQDDLQVSSSPSPASGITWLFASLLVGSLNVITEAFDPVSHLPLMQQDITLAGAGTPSASPTWPSSAGTPDAPLFPVRGAPRWRSAQAPTCTTAVKEELGRGVGLRLRADRGTDPDHGQRGRSRRAKGLTEGSR